jgi:putative proteasome-type protease
VGLLLDAGMVLFSDTRTNAGLDNNASYRKTFFFEEPGQKVVAILTAGSMSVTQTTIARLEEALSDFAGDGRETILSAPTMLQTAQIVGQTLSEVSAEINDRMDRASQTASASLIVAGQRKGGGMRMFLVYPEGNFIEATRDTPFLQIGEHKYGKPILDRVIVPETPLADAKKAVLLSMDSTLRSNLSVGMPLDLTVIEKDQYAVGEQSRIEPDDQGFQEMSRAWSQALRDAFLGIRV